MKEAQFLGPMLVESPLRFPILERIREKHDIDQLDATKHPFKQRFQQHMEHDPPIDWQAVHAEILQRLKDLLELLPEHTTSAPQRESPPAAAIGLPINREATRMVALGIRRG